MPLNASVHGEPPEKNHGHIDGRQSLRVFLGQGFVADLMVRDGVVTKNLRFAGPHGDVGSGEVSTLVLAGELLEPIVQRRLSAVEGSLIVRLGKVSRCSNHPRTFLYFPAAAVKCFIRTGFRGFVRMDLLVVQQGNENASRSRFERRVTLSCSITSRAVRTSVERRSR